MKLLKELANEISKAICKVDLVEGSKILKSNEYDVTRVIDAVAERKALELLKSQTEFNIITEESGYHDFGGKKTIVLDPLDGSFNAISGIPFYSVSIAVGTSKISDIEYGLVKNLVTGEEFEASQGKGAYLNGKRIKTKNFNPNDLAFSIYLSRYASSKSFELARKARRLRSLGCASLDICLVACGALDAYYQAGYPLRVTDVAAGALILREAGGEIYDDKFNLLDMAFELKTRKNVLAVGSKKTLELMK
ncbi:MAG: inositol monophosphatase family protein [Candidatus Thermoplasmatota archaeon]|nr:inositol monophosphatase family protein [Candidatus Thermoplasmatota archaeon]